MMAAAGAVALSGEHPAAAKASRCAPPSGTVLKADGRSVVWKRRGVYRACRTDTARTYTLGRNDLASGDVTRIALTGRFVAWERVACSAKGSTCFGHVIVRDLKRGTRREFAVPDLHRFAHDLVVSWNGAVAWIRLGPADRPNYHEVRAGERVLDAGTHIDPHSLAISGRRIYWMNGGTPRSALLSAERAVVSRLVIADGRTRVVERNGVHRACRNGRCHWMGTEDGPGGDVIEIALGGRFVAWERATCGKGSTCTGAIIVRDLERGTRRAFPIPPGERPAQDLVVSRSGSVAWIRLGNPDLVTYSEVWAADADGKRMLDQGDHVDTYSLAISGRRIYWTSGGSPRTALLSD